MITIATLHLQNVEMNNYTYFLCRKQEK